MRDPWRRYGPILKNLFTVALLGAIGYRFYVDLRQAPDLRELYIEPAWIAAAAGLYILGLAGSALFWFRLLIALDQRPSLWGAARAYYVGHLGKYLPGKAWALLLRTTLISGPNVRLGVAALTCLYEVLATMASGAILACCCFAWLDPTVFRDWGIGSLHRLWSSADLDRQLLMQSSPLLAVLVAVLIVPGVFNRLVRKASNPFLRADAQPLPAVSAFAFLQGLFMTSWHWLLLGASLCALMRGMFHRWPCDDPAGALLLVAYVSFAYVAGFVVVILPNGLLVRELMLATFLTTELMRLGMTAETAPGAAAMVVLLLRLVWTAAEVLLSAVLYLLPARGGS